MQSHSMRGQQFARFSETGEKQLIHPNSVCLLFILKFVLNATGQPLQDVEKSGLYLEIVKIITE